MPEPGDSAYVVVSLPSQGMLLGDVVGRHAGARLSAVEVGRHIGLHGPVVEFLALAEGIPDHDIANVLLAWNLRYGEPAHALGGPFALRLPVAVDDVPASALATMLRWGGPPALDTVVSDRRVEFWLACTSLDDAQALERRLGGLMRGVQGARVERRDPPPRDAECWGLLRLAAEVAPLDVDAGVPA